MQPLKYVDVNCSMSVLSFKFIALFYFTLHSAYVNLFSGFKHGTVSEV